VDNADEKTLSEQVNSRLDDLFGGDDADSSSSDSSSFGSEASEGPAPSTDEDSGADYLFQDGDESDPAGEDDDPMMAEPEEEEKEEEVSIIQDLKSVILSLEWEITDPVMQKLGEEIQKLEEECKDDKIVVAFLQLLGSLGKYIRKKRADAHPDSIRLLHSVFENLDLVMTGDLSDLDKKKLLVSQVNQYKKLKEDISTVKPESGPETPAQSAPVTPAAPTPVPSISPAISHPAESEPIRAKDQGAMGSNDLSQLILVVESIAEKLDAMNTGMLNEIRGLRKDFQKWMKGDM